jgi:hypothetical protein
MTARAPLVLSAAGLPEQLQSSDTLIGGPGPISTPAAYTAAHTIVATDVPAPQYAALLQMNATAQQLFTIPPFSSVPLPPGTAITIQAVGTGQSGFSAGAGVTLLSGSSLTTRAQNSCLTAIATATVNTWAVMGDMT